MHRTKQNITRQNIASGTGTTSVDLRNKSVHAKQVAKKLRKKKTNKPKLSRSARAARVQHRQKRQLAERMAQLRDTRMEVEMLSTTAGGSNPDVYSIAFNKAEYYSPHRNEEEPEEGKQQTKNVASKVLFSGRRSSVGFGSPRHIYGRKANILSRPSSSLSTSPSAVHNSSAEYMTNSPTLIRLQCQESKLEEEIRKINSTLAGMSSKPKNKPSSTTMNATSSPLRNIPTATEASLPLPKSRTTNDTNVTTTRLRLDTPRGRKTQLKQTREIESLKRGLDWEIQQFELSLNEFGTNKSSSSSNDDTMKITKDHVETKSSATHPLLSSFSLPMASKAIVEDSYFSDVLNHRLEQKEIIEGKTESNNGMGMVVQEAEIEGKTKLFTKDDTWEEKHEMKSEGKNEHTLNISKSLIDGNESRPARRSSTASLRQQMYVMRQEMQHLREQVDAMSPLLSPMNTHVRAAAKKITSTTDATKKSEDDTPISTPGSSKVNDVARLVSTINPNLPAVSRRRSMRMALATTSLGVETTVFQQRERREHENDVPSPITTATANVDISRLVENVEPTPKKDIQQADISEMNGLLISGTSTPICLIPHPSRRRASVTIHPPSTPNSPSSVDSTKKPKRGVTMWGMLRKSLSGQNDLKLPSHSPTQHGRQRSSTDPLAQIPKDLELQTETKKISRRVSIHFVPQSITRSILGEKSLVRDDSLLAQISDEGHASTAKNDYGITSSVAKEAPSENKATTSIFLDSIADSILKGGGKEPVLLKNPLRKTASRRRSLAIMDNLLAVGGAFAEPNGPNSEKTIVRGKATAAAAALTATEEPVMESSPQVPIIAPETKNNNSEHISPHYSSAPVDEFQATKDALAKQREKRASRRLSHYSEAKEYHVKHHHHHHHHNNHGNADTHRRVSVSNNGKKIVTGRVEEDDVDHLHHKRSFGQVEIADDTDKKKQYT